MLRVYIYFFTLATWWHRMSKALTKVNSVATVWCYKANWILFLIDLKVRLPSFVKARAYYFRNFTSRKAGAEPPKAVSVLMLPKLVKDTSVSLDPRNPIGHAAARDRRLAGIAPKKPLSCSSQGQASESIYVDPWIPFVTRKPSTWESKSHIVDRKVRRTRSSIFHNVSSVLPCAQSSTTKSPRSFASRMRWLALWMLPNKWEMTTSDAADKSRIAV